MSLSDRRLLIELGAVLAIKLAMLFLLKMHFFSPAAEDRRNLLEPGSAETAREGSQAASAILQSGAGKEP